MPKKINQTISPAIGERRKQGRSCIRELAAQAKKVEAVETAQLYFTTRKRSSSPWSQVLEQLEDLHKGEALMIPQVNSIPQGLKQVAKKVGAVLEYAVNGDGILVRIKKYVEPQERETKP
jgi:hypothetical protein